MVVVMNHLPPNSYRLMNLIALAQETLDRLRQEDGQIIETEDELRTALNEEGVSVDSIMAVLGRAALDAQAMVGMISQRMADLRVRQDRAERRVETIRATLLQAMQSLGLSTYGDPEFSASWRMGKAKWHVTDIDALPASCVKREENKRVIGDMLAVGPVPGVVVGNAAPILTLRSK